MTDPSAELAVPFVRTVCGDVPAADLGVCYAHEHLLGSPPPPRAEPDLQLTDFEAAQAELRSFRRAGGRALVEMSTVDYGRDAAGLKALSSATGVHVVCATGFNKDTFSSSYVAPKSVAELAALYIREVTDGIEGTDVRAGVVKAATPLNAITETAEKQLRAAAAAHRATGAPISTHTEAGTMALEQVSVFREEGVDPSHVIIGHVDRRLEWQPVRALAETGVYLSFDQISKEKYYPDSDRISCVVRLYDAGFGHRILLSGDLARRSYWPSYGFGEAPGLTYILRRFVPALLDAGLPGSAVDDLLIRNPARVLAFATASAGESTR